MSARWKSETDRRRDVAELYGQQIGKTPVGWAHTECVIERAVALDGEASTMRGWRPVATAGSGRGSPSRPSNPLTCADANGEWRK